MTATTSTTTIDNVIHIVTTPLARVTAALSFRSEVTISGRRKTKTAELMLGRRLLRIPCLHAGREHARRVARATPNSRYPDGRYLPHAKSSALHPRKEKRRTAMPSIVKSKVATCRRRPIITTRPSLPFPAGKCQGNREKQAGTGGFQRSRSVPRRLGCPLSPPTLVEPVALSQSYPRRAKKPAKPASSGPRIGGRTASPKRLRTDRRSASSLSAKISSSPRRQKHLLHQCPLDTLAPQISLDPPLGPHPLSASRPRNARRSAHRRDTASSCSQAIVPATIICVKAGAVAACDAISRRERSRAARKPQSPCSRPVWG